MSEQPPSTNPCKKCGGMPTLCGWSDGPHKGKRAYRCFLHKKRWKRYASTNEALLAWNEENPGEGK